MAVVLSFKNDPLARQAAEAILIREEGGEMWRKRGEIGRIVDKGITVAAADQWQYSS